MSGHVALICILSTLCITSRLRIPMGTLNRSKILGVADRNDFICKMLPYGLSDRAVQPLNQKQQFCTKSGSFYAN